MPGEFYRFPVVRVVAIDPVTTGSESFARTASANDEISTPNNDKNQEDDKLSTHEKDKTEHSNDGPEGSNRSRQMK